MMDRVLSYQTAMRANSNSSGFDIRQYISKRTCISLTMSIAFLMLILGFLLGKSTSDRHHLIREHNRKQNELILRSPQDIEKIEIALVNSAKLKLSTDFKEFYLDHLSTINNQLKDNFTECIESTTFDTSKEELEDFLRHLIREEFNSFIKCADNLVKFL